MKYHQFNIKHKTYNWCYNTVGFFIIMLHLDSLTPVYLAYTLEGQQDKKTTNPKYFQYTFGLETSIKNRVF